MCVIPYNQILPGVLLAVRPVVSITLRLGIFWGGPGIRALIYYPRPWPFGTGKDFLHGARRRRLP